MQASCSEQGQSYNRQNNKWPIVLHNRSVPGFGVEHEGDYSLVTPSVLKNIRSNIIQPSTTKAQRFELPNTLHSKGKFCKFQSTTLNANERVTLRHACTHDIGRATCTCSFIPFVLAVASCCSRYMLNMRTIVVLAEHYHLLLIILDCCLMLNVSNMSERMLVYTTIQQHHMLHDGSRCLCSVKFTTSNYTRPVHHTSFLNSCRKGRPFNPVA